MLLFYIEIIIIIMTITDFIISINVVLRCIFTHDMQLNGT